MSAPLRIAIASDHAGLEMKTKLYEHLTSTRPNFTIEDLGTQTKESIDYPDYAEKVAKAVQSGSVDFGILVCGTGIGMSIRANRYRGVRAALAWDDFTAEVCRAHNNSNVLCLGERTLSVAMAIRITDIWLNSDFEGGRHQRRVEKLDSAISE